MPNNLPTRYPLIVVVLSSSEYEILASEVNPYRVTAVLTISPAGMVPPLVTANCSVSSEGELEATVVD
jgi:hypothetical protein